MQVELSTTRKIGLSVLNHPVLVLNRSWIPFETTTVRCAFEKLFAEKAYFIHTDDCSQHDFLSWADIEPKQGQLSIRTSRLSLLAPEVILLTSHTKTHNKIMFTRRNVIRRDKQICQYCGKHILYSDLTIDHILPRSRGGKSSWDNCVASCFTCNSNKDNMTPEEAGMRLIVRPREPKWSPTFKVRLSDYKKSWSQFTGKS